MLPILGERGRRLYYLLATFDVLTVSLGFFLTHRIMTIYDQSVASNQYWVEIQSGISEIDQMASALNAPGNDVFDSHAIEREESRSRQAHGELQNRLLAMRQEILRADKEAAAPLQAILEEVGRTVDEQASEAQQVFADLKRRRPEEASRHMARMDRLHGSVNKKLDHLRESTSAIQRRSFQKETASAANVQKLEILLGVFLLLMVLGLPTTADRWPARPSSPKKTRQALLEHRKDADIRASGCSIRRYEHKRRSGGARPRSAR